MTTTSPRLACTGVSVRFGGIAALRGVDLEVAPDTIVGLVGPNGAGKSTLFGVLSGLLRPTEGRVFLDGRDVTGASPQRRAAGGLARTFQHPELFAGLTVREHLVVAHRARHARRRVWLDLLTMGSLHSVAPDERSGVDELVELLGLAAVADRPAAGLPLGVARLVELGRALATSPTVLLLDEPSSGLDSAETAQFEATLRRVNEERGISVLLVEHDVDLVLRLCAHVHVLDFGALIGAGSPEQVRADPAVRAAYLGEEAGGEAAERPIRHAGEGTSAIDGRSEETVAGAVGVPAALPQRAVAGDAVAEDMATALLQVDRIGVRYGDATALTEVSFRLATGRALAVLGANGAGKSSLARALSGLVRPAAGRVVFAGQDITDWPAYRVRRAGLLHLPEGRAVFRELSVIDNLRMASGVLDRTERQDAVDRALDIFPALAARRRLPARLLSGGEQQMLSLARALATSPRLLIADEMSLGLAPALVDLVFDGLRRARDTGVTVVMIEQYVHRALAFAEECVVLDHGRVAWSGPAQQAGNEVLRHYLGETMAVG